MVRKQDKWPVLDLDIVIINLICVPEREMVAKLVYGLSVSGWVLVTL